MTATGSLSQITEIAERVSNGMAPTPLLYANDWDIPCNAISDTGKLCRKPLVSIIALTYNHEKFIAQTIEGMAMQETDFEYEILLTEDCSQDRTRAICFEDQKRFPGKIRVLWAERNLYGFNFRRVRIRCQGKYIAYCDGDDYWTDPKKWQKQVEYMEGHPGCAGYFHERVKGKEEGRSIIVQRNWEWGQGALETTTSYANVCFPHPSTGGGNLLFLFLHPRVLAGGAGTFMSSGSSRTVCNPTTSVWNGEWSIAAPPLNPSDIPSFFTTAINYGIKYIIHVAKNMYLPSC